MNITTRAAAHAPATQPIGTLTETDRHLGTHTYPVLLGTPKDDARHNPMHLPVPATTFRGAVDLAQRMSTGFAFISKPTFAVLDAHDGSFLIQEVNASLEPKPDGESGTHYSVDSVTRTNADLLALVSKHTWVDLRHDATAEPHTLWRIPGVGPLT